MADESSASLEKLRGDIDRIDQELHKLLRERAAVVQRIGLAKRSAGNTDAPIVRPGREADLMRSLIERHDGALPAAAVARIWREIVANACRMQSPFRVAMHAPERSISHWDLVRNHFGSTAPITLCGSARRVLQELEDPQTIGVLPWPDHDGPDPWWPHIASPDAKARIVSVLPFYESSSGHFEDRRLMIVATYPPEASGNDLSYIAVQTDPEVSRTRLGRLLEDADLKGSAISTSHRGDKADGELLHLIEAEGFIQTDDPRLEKLTESADGQIRRALVIGAAARPLGRLDA